MAIINQNNVLNLQPGITAPVVVHMSEGDVGTKLSFKLIDGVNAWTDPGNVVAAVHGRRQDGTQFGPYACTISGDVVSFQTDAAMAGAAGSGIAQIVLTDSDQNTAGSANFAVMVERATFPMGVTYTNDKSVYEAILAYVQTIPAQVTRDYTTKIEAEAAAREAADTSLQSQITAEVDARANQDSVLSARMDEFTKLPDGSLSTAADAELADIRVMENGETATTAGNAVRAQVSSLDMNIGELEDAVYSFDNLFVFTKSAVSLNGITCIFTRSGVTFNGTASAGGSMDYVFKIHGLKPSTTYTLRMFNVVGLGGNQAMYIRQGSTTLQAISFASTGANAGPRGVTFTTPADITGIYGRIFFNGNTGTLTNAHADIMVVESSTIPTAYISASEIKLVTEQEFVNSVEELHDEITDVESVAYGISAKNTYQKTIAITGSSIIASTHIFDVAIPAGEYFSFRADFVATSYAIYANGALLFPNLSPNEKYYFQAAEDITYVSIYSNSITGNSADFELELIEYSPYGGVGAVSGQVSEIGSGFISIPHLMLVGFYNPDGSKNHTAAGNEFHTDMISVLPGEEIKTALTYDDKTSTVVITAMLYDSEKAIVGRANITLSAVGEYSGVYTVPSGVYYVSFQPAMRDGADFGIYRKLETDGLGLPPYYNVNGYIQDKVRTIASTIADAHGDYDVFIFNTDQHWPLNAKNSPKLIHYICDCIPIKKLFLGGDLDDGINLQAEKAFADAFNGDVYELIGNHELMNYVFDLNGSGVATTVTDSLVCAYYGTRLTNVVFGNVERQYYYVDDTTRKTRYILLAVFTDDGDYAKYQFESTQQTWFRDVALDLPTGYTAVILVHSLYRVEYGTGAMTLFENALQPIIDIINNYSGAGKIACVFAGHMHLDGMTTLESGVPVFVTTCDKYKAFVSGGTDLEPWLTSERIKGTITEQAFDVVVVDKLNKRVSAIRIGAPAYNSGSTELEVRTANYV